MTTPNVLYDDWGWYTESQVYSGRVAPSPPLTPYGTGPVEGQLWPNWTGYDWQDVIYVTPLAPPVITPPVDPCEWLIDVGPFFDRFGAAKLSVLTSADATVKAILQDIQVRKWIDLKRADVASSLAYVGTKVPAVDATLQASILNTPVVAADNLALRKLFFS